MFYLHTGIIFLVQAIICQNRLLQIGFLHDYGFAAEILFGV